MIFPDTIAEGKRDKFVHFSKKYLRYKQKRKFNPDIFIPRIATLWRGCFPDYYNLNLGQNDLHSIASLCIRLPWATLGTCIEWTTIKTEQKKIEDRCNVRKTYWERKLEECNAHRAYWRDDGQRTEQRIAHLMILCWQWWEEDKYCLDQQRIGSCGKPRSPTSWRETVHKRRQS